MTVQAGLCRTCSKTTLLVFPRGGSFYKQTDVFAVVAGYKYVGKFLPITAPHLYITGSLYVYMKQVPDSKANYMYMQNMLHYLNISSVISNKD